MNGQFDLLTLIALVIAVAAVLKLRKVLGQRTDEDDRRLERLKSREADATRRTSSDAPSADVITMPRRDRDTTPTRTAQDIDATTVETRIRAYPVTDASVTDGLLQISKLDPALDPVHFLVGAKQAYEMIVTAFADGNRKLLKDMLSRDVYEGFVAAISEREARGEVLDQQFVGIKNAEILEAELKGGVASLTVRFVSELISAVRNKAGEQISGDAQKIKDVTDIWTFCRDVSTERARSNANWRLEATQSPN